MVENLIALKNNVRPNQANFIDTMGVMVEAI